MTRETELSCVLRAALEWIDALPRDVVATLPAMPGFNRDWADELINSSLNEDPEKLKVLAEESGLSDYLFEQMGNDEIEWSPPTGDIWVHDWRTHIGENVQKIWKDIPMNVRIAITADAEFQAHQEEWE